MAVNEESNAFGLEQGCAFHGDEHMKECSMCGAEFCRICVPRSAVCPDCVDQTNDEDEKDNSDFDDIAHVEDVVEDEEKDAESTEDIVEEDIERD